MAKKRDLKELAKIANEDGRYAFEAFHLVWECLQKTAELVKKGRLKHLAPQVPNRSEGNPGRFHVTGQELLEGFRLHAREQYGNMAFTVLERLGLRRTEDVGEIVFMMVAAGYMGKRATDTPEDFANSYDFAEAFAPQDILEES